MPAADAARLSQLPPTAVMFAALLGLHGAAAVADDRASLPGRTPADNPVYAERAVASLNPATRS